jgi:predicted nuclease of predicted toxin-antitoxin system
MKLLADENIDEPIVDWLLTLSIDLIAVRRSMPGITDTKVMEIARTTNRIILTNDLDFGELIFHQKLSSAGIILLRVHPPLPMERLRVLQQHWTDIALKAEGHFLVATERKLRIRPLL